MPTQCEDLPIIINGATAGNTISPPYFAFIYPVSGTPTIIPFGSQTSGNLNIPYKSGTKIVIGFVDAFSKFGGWSPVYTVASDSESESDCLSEVASPKLTLGLNTTEVTTCDVVGMTVSGGVPPYTVTVFPEGSVSSTTNTTLPTQDSYFAWVNTVQPASTMGVGVRDSVGNWANTGGPLTTNGDARTCSRSSTSYVSAPANSGPTDAGNGGSKSNAGAIAGGVVGGIVALALILALVWFLRRRKRRNAPVASQSHSAAWNGPPSPVMQANDGSSAAAVTPFALSSHSGSQAPRHSSDYSHVSLPPPSAGGFPMTNTSHNHSGFHIANPDTDAEQLNPPAAAFAGHNRNGSIESMHSRSSLPQPPVAGSSTGVGENGRPLSQGAKGILDVGPRDSSGRPVVQRMSAIMTPDSADFCFTDTDAGRAADLEATQDEIPPACWSFIRSPLIVSTDLDDRSWDSRLMRSLRHNTRTLGRI